MQVGEVDAVDRHVEQVPGTGEALVLTPGPACFGPVQEALAAKMPRLAQGAAGETNSQTFNGTTIANGPTHIIARSAEDGAANLNLGDALIVYIDHGNNWFTRYGGLPVVARIAVSNSAASPTPNTRS